MKTLLLATALLIAIGQINAQVKVPYDKASVMIDGRFEPREWEKAAKMKVNDSMNLYVKQDAENLYFCIHAATPAPAVLVVDIYLTLNNQLLNLHASAQLGERTWQQNTYGPWVWWNNTGWMATVARIDKFAERKFHRDEAKEFQLRKERFKDKEIRMMFDMGFPQSMIMKFPAAADTTNTSGWLHLKL